MSEQRTHHRGNTATAAAPSQPQQPTESAPPPPPPPPPPNSQFRTVNNGFTWSDFLRALKHEGILLFFGSIVVFLVWMLFVKLFKINFPYIHLLLIFIGLIAFAHMDHREYPYDIKTSVYFARAGINLGVFLIGLSITRWNARSYLQPNLPQYAVGSLLALTAIGTIFGLLRCVVHLAGIIVKYFA